MVSETSTNLCPGIEGSGFDDPEFEGDDPQPEAGYSIRGRCGEDIEAQVRLANHHIDIAVRERRRADLLAAPIEEEIRERLERVAEIRGPREARAERNEGFVLHWARDPATQAELGKTIPLGRATVSVLATRPKTELNVTAIEALAQTMQDLWAAGIVRTQVVVDKALARKRFTLRDGRTLDLTTGEVIEPVPHIGPDGQDYVSPVIVETEPAGQKATIKYAAKRTAPVEGVN